jgi:hypothetical protein
MDVAKPCDKDGHAYAMLECCLADATTAAK